MRRSSCLFAAVLALVLAGAAPAAAQCVLSGGTVTCTGADDDGFVGGANLTVRVETGALVDSVYDGNPDTLCPVFRSALRLGPGARVTNLGQIAGRGNCALGIDAGNGLTLANDGTILTDSEVAFAVLAGDAFTVTNRGTLRTTNAGSPAFVGGSNGSVLNAAGALIDTAGGASAGLVAENGNTLTNDGRIVTTGVGSIGIDAGAGNTIVNAGTIVTTGVASPGIRLRGAGNTVTNRGTITALPVATPRDGEDSIGILAEVGGVNIRNTGTIAGDYAGVVAGGTGSQVFNDGGTITARAPAAGRPGGAIVIEDSATVLNGGTIRGNGSAAIRVRGGALTLVNNGIIEGDVILGSVANTLTLGQSAISGTVDGRNATNRLILSDSGALSNVFLGRYEVEKIGAGSFVLLRNYAFGGTLRIREGGINLASDSYEGPVIIEAAGALTGTGFVSGGRGSAGFLPTNVTNAGRIRPSGRFNAITLVGTYTQTATGRLQLDVGNAVGGGPSRFLVDGIANLDGELALNLTGTLTPILNGQTFTVLSAPAGGTLSIRGAFAQVTDDSPFFLHSTASVTGNAVTVRVTRTPVSVIATTPAERQLAAYADREIASAGNFGVFGWIQALDRLSEADARAAFATATSDLPAAAQTWGLLAGQGLVNAVSPWLELAPADSPRGGWRTWGGMFARTGESGPKTDNANFDYDAYGVTAAVDYAVVDGLRLGVVAAHTDGDVAFASGNATGNLSQKSVGLYAAFAGSGWRLGAGALTGDGELASSRVTTLAVNRPTLLAALADADLDIAFAQASYALGTETWLLKPTAAMSYVKAKIGGMVEPIPNGMIVQAATASALRGEAGLRAIAKPGPVHITLAAFWSQNFKDNDRTVRASLERPSLGGGVLFPNSAFTIVGRAEKRGWLTAQAGVNVEIAAGLMGRLGWSGVLNDRLGGHTATAGLSYRW